MPPFPNIRRVGLTFDLLTWMSIGIIYSSRTIYLPSLKLQGQSVPELSVAQGLRDWHDHWPSDLTINMDHVLIKDYLPTKFEASGAKRCWVIRCTRFERLTWPLTWTFDLLTWLSIGIIYSSRTIYLPSLKLLGQSVIELSVEIAVCKTQMPPPLPQHKKSRLNLWPTDLNVNRDHLLIKDYLPTKFEASGAKCSRVIRCTRFERLIWPLTLTFYLLTWLSIGIINSSRTINLPSLKLLGKALLSYQLHKVWETDMTFDLDLWPTDLTINRDHLLTKDYLPTKFEASGAKCFGVISCTSLMATDRPTDRHVQRNMPLLLRRGGGHKYWVLLHNFFSKIGPEVHATLSFKLIISEWKFTLSFKAISL